MQQVKEGSFSMAKKIEILEVNKRKLLGEGLEPCSTDELQQLENQLDRSLSRIRARKNQLFREQIEKLKDKEKILLEENKKLREKCGMQLRQQSLEQEEVHVGDMDVETELYIGPPERRSA
ncbi:hypothetical protein JRO89_XS13G0042400 [Xanthoceras sorbifolium]|uniref:K-box domain-containing protein n=1 Tax=Xanthoceras sorbifolium TaxID=99658 RepID=A0ABQ8H6G1_9ROSI|nr:hypothetical protein JRO89_XS13G0042400 [Xanthoceras sorbifolium]